MLRGEIAGAPLGGFVRRLGLANLARQLLQRGVRRIEARRLGERRQRLRILPGAGQLARGVGQRRRPGRARRPLLLLGAPLLFLALALFLGLRVAPLLRARRGRRPRPGRGDRRSRRAPRRAPAATSSCGGANRSRRAIARCRSCRLDVVLRRLDRRVRRPRCSCACSRACGARAPRPRPAAAARPRRPRAGVRPPPPPLRRRRPRARWRSASAACRCRSASAAWRCRSSSSSMARWARRRTSSACGSSGWMRSAASQRTIAARNSPALNLAMPSPISAAAWALRRAADSAWCRARSISMRRFSRMRVSARSRAA